MGLKTDQDPTEMGRLGVDLNFVPSIIKINVGGSALHNSNNTALLTSTGTKQAWNDNVGFDATLEIPMLQSKIWGEWVSQNNFTNTGKPGTFVSRQEGWYVVESLKPLAFLDKDMTQLEINARIENMVPFVDQQAIAPKYLPTSVQAATVGAKYFWAGKNYTSVNYTAYALNGNYGALAPASLIAVQQQFNY